MTSDALALHLNSTENVAELLRCRHLIDLRLAHLCQNRDCASCNQCDGKHTLHAPISPAPAPVNKVNGVN